MLKQLHKILPEQAQVLQSAKLGPRERPQSQEAHVQTDKENTDMPVYFKQMFLDNNSKLSDKQKLVQELNFQIRGYLFPR